MAAITNLPAPVMDDTANDVWSLGVVLFQMLACTVQGPQVCKLLVPPVGSNYHIVGSACSACSSKLSMVWLTLSAQVRSVQPLPC